MRSRWWSPPWRARPTSWSPGAARRRRCTTPSNTTRWSPRANSSPPACWRSCSRRWASTRARGRAGKFRSAPTTRTARRASTASTARRSSTASRKANRGRRRLPGRHARGRVTTLGRGGSDTSAVALAAALGADRCDIYTDVDGVYTTDPRVVPKARRLDKVSFEEMLEMASLGAKVLQVRSVEMAMVHKVRLFVRSSFDDPDRAEAGHADLRRGGHRGTAGRDRHRLFARRSADHVAQRRRQARRRGGDFSSPRRGEHQRRHDHPGRLRRHHDDRHHLHRAERRIRPRQGHSRTSGARRSAIPR